MEQNSLIKIGNLKAFPFVELMRIAIVENLTGVFRLSHERIKSVVYFHEGSVVYSASNVRTQRLSECLNRWNILTPEKTAKVGQKPTDFEYAESLVSNQLIQRESVPDLFIKQSVEVLRSLLLWTDGEWEFDGRVRLAETMRFDVPITELLLEGARRLTPQLAQSRFAHEQEKITPVKNFKGNIQLQPLEAFILSRVDMPLQLTELLAISGMPQDITLHTLYTLAICGVVQRESWPTPFSESELKKLQSMEVSTNLSAKNSQASIEPPVTQTTEAPKPIPPKPEIDVKMELETFLIRIETAQNHYEILGIPKLSDDSTVKNTYHNLVKKFHPDRFHSEAGKPIHIRLQTAFAKLSHSYEKLKDPNFKTLYDKKLESGNVNLTQGTGDKKKIAEEKFQQGLTALSQNNFDAATTLFGQAVMLESNEARYHAHYGRMLSKNKNMRKQAETELQQAIKLDSKNVSFKVMLAEFYFDMKLYKRAESEVQRALSIEPNNKEAKRLLDSIQNK